MATAEKPQKEQPTKFTKAQLIANAAVFNVAPEIVAGALHNVEEATKAETEKAIKSFLEKPKKGANK